MVVIEHLNKWHTVDGKKHTILKDINLHIKCGEFIVLRGVSGSGKTTLLSIIAGADRPSSGKLLVDGEAIAKLPDMHLSRYRAKRVGMIFQHFNLIESLTLLENTLVPLIPLKIALSKAKEMAYQALKSANIEHKVDAYPAQLSGGEKQRGAIARAIVANAPLLLCDEPTANLDRENSLRFIEKVKALNGQGKTVIVATHDPVFETLDISHRVIDIQEGGIA